MLYKENFYVPTITNTTPIEGKEIDLTFVRFAQQKRNALDYIESVRLKEEQKWKWLKRIVNGLLEHKEVFYDLILLLVTIAFFIFYKDKMF